MGTFRGKGDKMEHRGLTFGGCGSLCCEKYEKVAVAFGVCIGGIAGQKCHETYENHCTFEVSIDKNVSKEQSESFSGPEMRMKNMPVPLNNHPRDESFLENGGFFGKYRPREQRGGCSSPEVHPRFHLRSYMLDKSYFGRGSFRGGFQGDKMVCRGLIFDGIVAWGFEKVAVRRGERIGGEISTGKRHEAYESH